MATATTSAGERGVRPLFRYRPEDVVAFSQETNGGRSSTVRRRLFPLPSDALRREGWRGYAAVLIILSGGAPPVNGSPRNGRLLYAWTVLPATVFAGRKGDGNCADGPSHADAAGRSAAGP